MAESLALKYRPRTFDDLVGQRAVQVFLRTMVAQNKIRPALLFDGSRGTGKTSTARILAAALNCDETPVPCGHCPSCKSVFDGTSLDLVEIDAASNGLVDDIRQLRQQVMYSVGGRYRVVALDEAHSMSGAAFNALLKTLEEPPPGTVFVLLTTEPGRIPDTVLSRCLPFTFRRIGIADTVGRLSHIARAENLSVDEALLTLIAERADGGLRDAIMALDQISSVGVSTVADYIALMGEIDHGPALLTALLGGEPARAFTALNTAMVHTGDPATITSDLIAVLRDTLILNSGDTIAKQGNALTIRHRLAEAIAPSQAMAALTFLWELKTKLRADEPRTALEITIAMLANVFARAAAAPAPKSAKLSLAQMAQMRP